MHGLMYIVTAILCLLIQLNCIKLQPSLNILIWVVWLFYHPVFSQTSLLRQLNRLFATSRQPVQIIQMMNNDFMIIKELQKIQLFSVTLLANQKFRYHKICIMQATSCCNLLAPVHQLSSNSRSTRMSFSQVQCMFIVKHYLAFRFYLTCQNKFRDTFPDSPVQNKSRLMNHFRDSSLGCTKHEEKSECMHRWTRWTFLTLNITFLFCFLISM
jgi:hypothetical protein